MWPLREDTSCDKWMPVSWLVQELQGSVTRAMFNLSGRKPHWEHKAAVRVAYVVSLTGALYSQWGLRPLNVKYCVCLYTPQFLYQLTHRHPFIAYGVFPEWSHKYLYGKTSNFYTSRTRAVRHYFTGCWSPSMHLSAAQCRQYWLLVSQHAPLCRPMADIATERTNLSVQNFTLA